MYAGNDSTDAQSYNQWPLNPSSYQNMSNDEVDWAALAQQWIIMKEAGPPVPDQITNVPVPTVSKPVKKEISMEGGEAPMEVENDVEDSQPQWNDGSGDSWSWKQQQQPQTQPQQPHQSWGWGNSWSSPSGVPPPNSVKTPLLPTPPAYNQYSSNDTCNDNNNYGYTSVPPSDYQGGYWTSAAGSSKVIKPHNKRYSKVNVPTAVAASKPVTIDAAKRKQLPAWIREGLEKMERDKLKQLDKERERLEKEEYDAKMKLNEKNALEILKTAVKEQQKSKFESDAEDSGDDTDGRPLTPEPVPLTQEELMLKVRRTMTEILLKVTNREIYNICREELQRHLKKLKASDQRVSAPSGANLSAKLGLGAYGGSGSSSESSDGESYKDHHDSDADLKDTIKRRKAEFSKTEREIEIKLAEAERDGESSRAVTPDNSENDSQVDAKISGGKGKMNAYEKTPPIRKRKSHRTTSSSSDSDSDTGKRSRSKDKRLTRDRRSSSSLSSRSDKYKRSKYSRSRTPDQKHSDHKRRYSESKSSRRSRSKSPISRRRRSRSSSTKRSSRRDSRYSKRSQSRSRSRSSSRSRHRSSYDRFRRSTSRTRRSSSRTYTSRRRRSRSSQRSTSHKYRRSRSNSNGRGKRSQRY